MTFTGNSKQEESAPKKHMKIQSHPPKLLAFTVLSWTRLHIICIQTQGLLVLSKHTWYSTKPRLTRFYFHCGPFHITLSFGICYSEVERVGPFYQIGQEEDRMMV